MSLQPRRCVPTLCTRLKRHSNYLVADECVDHPIIEALRRAGHDVQAVVELSAGLSDAEVLSLAHRNNALLFTQDTDFGELVYRPGQASSGELLLRLAGTSAVDKVARVVQAIEQHGKELAGAFAVLDALSYE